MAIAPSPDNYTLGKGVVYFDKLINGVYFGERDMGNTPAFTLSVSMDKLEHFNARSGLKAKDKTVITELTPTVAFQLDEVNVENIALMFMADTTKVVQAADDDKTFNIPSTLANRRYYSGFRSIGIWVIPITNLQSGPFEVGETITGYSSTATAVITRVDADQLCIKTIAGGPFEDGEEITGGNSNATADVASTDGEVFDTTDVVVRDGTDTYYTKGVDYSVDSVTGMVFLINATTIADISDIDIDFGVAAVTYTRITGFAQTSIEGMLHFVPDNPVGNNMELKIWRVDLAPDGDVGMIGDDWQLLNFTGEVLKDEVGHSSSPYMDIITSDVI